MFGGWVFQPVEDGWALMADGGVTVEGEEDVSFLTQLTHKSFGLTTLPTHKKQTIIRFKAVKEISPTPCRLVLKQSSSPHSPVWCALQMWCGSLWGSSWVCRWRCRSNPEGSTCHRSPQSADGLVAAGIQTNVLKLCLRWALTQETKYNHLHRLTFYRVQNYKQTKRRWTIYRLFTL